MTRFQIGGKDYTDYVTLPITVQTTLDDQLDSAMITLSPLPIRDPFKPFERVTLTVDGVDMGFLTANDNVTEIFGRGLYRHELTLVEETKKAERILCEGKNFTQPIVKNYSDGKTLARKNYISMETGEIESEELMQDGTLYSPIVYTGTLRIPLNGSQRTSTYWMILGDILVDTVYGKIIVAYAESYGEAEEILLDVPVSTLDLSGTVEINAPYTDGCYIVRVYTGEVSLESGYGHKYDIPIYCYREPTAKDPYTIDRVLHDVLETCEPLRRGLDAPRYSVKYRDDQQTRIGEMLAPPQISFANGRSLWENLRELGMIGHFIPRIEGDKVLFDDLGSSKRANMSDGYEHAHRDSYSAGDYTAALESIAANLINAEDGTSGAVTDPFEGGFRSLRASDDTARIKDESGIIETTGAVEKITRLLCSFTSRRGERVTCDLTPYVFERSEYDLLSAYSGGYPYSKTYALYYTQGGKNIEGLWFRSQDSGSSIIDSFERPAIVNILSVASGLPASSISVDYADMCFQVSYITFATARIRQHRMSYAGSDELVMAYNQSANRLSSRAFGEAIRGQVAMMGTTSTSKIFSFRRFSDVPRPGLLFDDENYISNITTRIYKKHCVSEIALSTGYNELGAYAEMNNAIRQYEIVSGEKRFTLLEEFCVIGSMGEDDENTAATYEFKLALMRMLEGDEARGSKRITLAAVSTYDDTGAPIVENVMLPVTSFSIGTSLYFGTEMLTNTTVGKSSEDPPSSSAKYRLQKDVRYSDEYYATATDVSFSMFTAPSMDVETLPFSAHEFPKISEGVTLGTALIDLGEYPLIWHKDTADSGALAYQLHFVTDSGYIIGSGIARCAPFTKNNVGADRARFYFFGDRLNQLTGRTDTENAIASSEFSLTSNAPFGITVDSIPTVHFESWALIRGDEFLIGKNSGTIEKTIYFKYKRKRRS